MSETYNGHPNYASWNVSLWIGNEEPSYRYWRDIGQVIFESEMVERLHSDGFSTQLVNDASRHAIINLAAQLKYEITEQFNSNDYFGQADKWGDITDGDTLNSVHWRNVAEGILEEAHFTTDEDHEVSFDLPAVYQS